MRISQPHLLPTGLSSAIVSALRKSAQVQRGISQKLLENIENYAISIEARPLLMLVRTFSR